MIPLDPDAVLAQPDQTKNHGSRSSMILGFISPVRSFREISHPITTGFYPSSLRTKAGFKDENIHPKSAGTNWMEN